MLKREYFLPTITTTKASDWRAKIKEIDELGLEKIAVFPTCFKEKQRLELYSLLEKTELKQIPFIHIRGDMSPKELDYLIKRWRTEVFNIHTAREYPVLYDYSQFKDMIYLEDVYLPFDEEELKQFAGICLDFAHLENDKRFNLARAKNTETFLEKYPLGCNHISAVKKKPGRNFSDSKEVRWDRHYFEELEEFDYLKQYPLKYFSKFIAIELENPLKDQLKVIDYILELRIKN